MLSPKRLLISILAGGFFACSSVIVYAQEFRGSISGRVTEATGASVPGAQVTITNTATNTSTTLTTNAEGNYSALYLNPGQYQVTVEAKGFRKMLRQGVEVRVGDKLELNLALEVGRVSEAVTVTADAPLLESSTASAGQVIDQRRISELPLSDGNPFVLSRLSPGIAYVGDLKFSRPFDNSGAAAVIADGAPGKNEFTLDGTPNMAGTGGTNGAGRVAFVPPADAVQEFKVETASYDGQQSHTAAATVNVTLKNGTNQLHGSVYEFVRNDVLSANDFFINRTNLAANPARDKNQDGKADRDSLHYNRYGFTVGGPVSFPKKVFGPLGYDGRNRSFFFFSLEKLKDVFPEPALFTVPTLAERNGDFSALLPSILIYDPASGVAAAGGRVQRTAFSGNIIPANRISAIAKNYLQYYPLPNQPGDSQGRNNYISGQPRFDTFHSESYRFDQTLSEKQRFFVRYTHNWRRENRNNWTGEVNGIVPVGNYLYRINNGGSFDHLYNFSPTVVLNTRVGYSRFNEANVRQNQGVFDPASLGFPAATAALFGPEKYLPQFDIGNFSTLGNTVGDGSTYNIYSVQPTLTKLAGKHSFKLGYDFRSYRENAFNAGHAAGNYQFSNAFTKGPLDNSAGGAIGQELAAFLLGRTTGGSIDRNTSRSSQTLYHGMFFHDDWKVSSRLTLNLGLRYEYEGATTERYNRNIFGFDQTASSPIEAAAKAAYAVSPIPEIAAGSFNVKGGLLFADDSHRSFWDADKNNLQPRLGFAYKLNDKTVLRGGWGVYTVPFIIDGVRQSGFSQSTPIVGSNDNGLTFVSSLATPFPSGVLAAAGASLGLSTFLGQGITFVPRDYRNAQAQRWSLGAQRELPGNWLVEVQYVGNHGSDLTVGTNILNAVPKKYLSTSLFRDQSQIDANSFLTTTVTNPFRNLIPGTGFNNATIARSQLLRPFPEFGTITTFRTDGDSDYHSLQARLEKRFSQGYTLSASYTWSKFLEAASFLNDVDTEFERRLNVSDIPQRLVMSGIWEIPFGHGRKFGANWHRAVDTVLGGWQFGGIVQLQSGTPISIGNVYYNGDITKLKTEVKSNNVDGGIFDISGFYFTDAAVQTNGVVDPVKQRADPRISLTSNYRTLPSRFSGFRGDNLNLWDLSVSKNFSFTEKIRLQMRGEFLNAFNTPNFASPNLTPSNSSFGKITGQNNLARNIQIGLKVIF